MFVAWKFLLFVLIVFLVYWWLIPVRWRPHFLTIASFTYFVLILPREMFFLFLLAIAVYLWGMALQHTGTTTRRILLAAGVLLLVADLGFFKYAHWLMDILNRFISLTGNNLSYQLPDYFIPLGISYFTFKMISYLIEIRKGTLAKHQVIDFLNYIFFFPTLISGPIERFQPFYEQSIQEKQLQSADLYNGLPRIFIGLFKKVVLADSLAIVAAGLQQPELSATAYWVATLAYTLQIYFDFSGYSDMAIGISLIFGYRIRENFRSPYFAKDLSDFWKRWHMSLTGWFRDYLFIPLGGSRVPFYRIIINTWIVMAVTGLWHGAAWHFVLWGMYHAGGLTVLRLYRRYLKPQWPEFNGRLINTTLTFLFVSIGWVWFACDSRQAWFVITRMFGG